MGPERFKFESLSMYRMRSARYCLRWVIWLGLPLALLLTVAPRVASSSAPLLLMFLYVGLLWGLAVATIAAFGLFSGGLWACILERHPSIARMWPKAKVTLKALALSPVAFFCLYVISSGVAQKKVFIPQRRGNGLPMVAWADEPMGYVVCMAVWCLIAVALVVYLYKEMRRAFVN